MSDSDPLPAPRSAPALVGPNPRGAVGRISLAVRSFLRPHIDEGDALALVAVSGGADSLALAVATIDLCARSGVPVHTLTVDHSLREGSAREAVRVVELLGSLGAQAHLATVHVRGPGGPESAARDARRAALEELALELRARAGVCRVLVLLGHTMDDQAETVLLRLARGSGAGSLRAMAPEVVQGDGVHWCRPLLGVRRRDTGAACEQLGLEWVEDPTNEPDGPWRAGDGTPLRRSAVRAWALPALAQALGEDPVPALARTAHLLALDDDALGAAAAELSRRARRPVPTTAATATPAAPTVPTPAPPTALNPAASTVPDQSCAVPDTRAPDTPAPVLLDVPTLAAAEPAVRNRVIHAALLSAGARPGAVSATHVEGVAALVTHWHGQGPLDLPGVQVRRHSDAGAPVLEVRPAPRR